MTFPILIFDSECPLCVRFTQALKLIDKQSNIQFEPLDNDSLYETFPILNRNECEEVVHLLLSNEEVLKGGAVIEYLIQQIPAVEKFAWLMDPESTKKASEAFYKSVNEVRKFIKKNGCKSCGKASRRKEL